MTIQTPGPADRADEMQLELSALWNCSANAYGAYFASLAAARSPYDLINANAVLAADLAELGGLASAAMLRRGGMTAPTLNESRP
ncbi:hypothetical protein [Phenylobacterium sp.]|jgi:hypothetical protein|uniref:hypothetical protein n=1 Tax=Phenylobacterium sp. TaxID=1871053 RepID=UPI0035B4996C